MSFVIMELKPAEVDYLNSMWRCRLCDHLMSLHRNEQESIYKHCGWCEDHNGDCDGLDWVPASGECLIPDCGCTG